MIPNQTFFGITFRTVRKRRDNVSPLYSSKWRNGSVRRLSVWHRLLFFTSAFALFCSASLQRWDEDENFFHFNRRNPVEFVPPPFSLTMSFNYVLLKSHSQTSFCQNSFLWLMYFIDRIDDIYAHWVKHYKKSPRSSRCTHRAISQNYLWMSHPFFRLLVKWHHARI